MSEPLVETLIAATGRLLGRPLGPAERVGIAVSGGADSMALLSLAARAWPGRVAAASVDHGLRADAAEEVAMVARFCAAHGIGHHRLEVSVPPDGNLLQHARDARYAALEAWADEARLDWLMTAHQADDLFETMLMRLGRGAGEAGLGAIRARRGRWLRPLLGVRRAALRSHCQKAGVPFIDDPSNEDARFDRARLRASLGGALPVDPERLARSATALADADEALEWAAGEIARDHLRLGQGSARLDRTDLPAALLRRLLQRMIDHVRPQSGPVRGPRMDQALVQLSCGRSVALADCVVTGGAVWSARAAPPRRARGNEGASSGRAPAIAKDRRHLILRRESERP